MITGIFKESLFDFDFIQEKENLTFAWNFEREELTERKSQLGKMLTNALDANRMEVYFRILDSLDEIDSQLSDLEKKLQIA